MNFENMPELKTQWGYFVILGVIAAVCIGLYIRFKRSHWLSRRRSAFHIAPG